jgi:hypothetical protein
MKTKHICSNNDDVKCTYQGVPPQRQQQDINNSNPIPADSTQHYA